MKYLNASNVGKLFIGAYFYLFMHSSLVLGESRLCNCGSAAAGYETEKIERRTENGVTRCYRTTCDLGSCRLSEYSEVTKDALKRGFRIAHRNGRWSEASEVPCNFPDGTDPDNPCECMVGDVWVSFSNVPQYPGQTERTCMRRVCEPPQGTRTCELKLDRSGSGTVTWTWLNGLWSPMLPCGSVDASPNNNLVGESCE